MNSSEKIKILLVDDEVGFLHATARALFRRGFDVFQATGGLAALRLLDLHPIQVVVLDVKMPEMDGFEVLRQIQLREAPPPVIMLTGHGKMDSAIAAGQRGAFDFLAKPCNIDRLVTLATKAAGLPLPPTDQRPPAPSAPQNSRWQTPSPDLPPVKLLIIDDEQDLLDSLANVFRRRGLQVFTAPSGHQGLALAADQDVDVVLLDLTLPEMDGIEILRQLRELRPTTEVILLTGHPSMGSAAEGIKEGVFDYMIKPQSIPALLDRIVEAYRRRYRIA